VALQTTSSISAGLSTFSGTAQDTANASAIGLEFIFGGDVRLNQAES